MSELFESRTFSGCLGNRSSPGTQPSKNRPVLPQCLFAQCCFLFLCPRTATAPHRTCKNETFVFAFSRAYMFLRICINFIFEQLAGLLEYRIMVECLSDGRHIRFHLEPVLCIRIWIGLVPHHFPGSGSVLMPCIG